MGGYIAGFLEDKFCACPVGQFFHICLKCSSLFGDSCAKSSQLLFGMGQKPQIEDKTHSQIPGTSELYGPVGQFVSFQANKATFLFRSRVTITDRDAEVGSSWQVSRASPAARPWCCSAQYWGLSNHIGKYSLRRLQYYVFRERSRRRSLWQRIQFAIAKLTSGISK